MGHGIFGALILAIGGIYPIMRARLAYRRTLLCSHVRKGHCRPVLDSMAELCVSSER